jgi:methylthioribulose 1-phosphate dehydratase/enolase-phosphatase E1
MSSSGSKKRVSITAPSDAPTTRLGGKKAAPRRSMGPRQQSLPAFTPDNYSSDEDDKFYHEDAATKRKKKKTTMGGDHDNTNEEEKGDDPGSGWTNGQVPPQFTPTMTLHPYTRSGRLMLYSHHRRWINFQSSWSRIGKGSTELDAVHKESSLGQSIMTGCLIEEGKTVRALVAQLCECFYKAGWATGTGGGVSIRVGGPAEHRPYRVFVAPSGVQKEDMVGDDVFELDMERNVVSPPKTPNLRQSACTPLWYVVYKRVPTAMCVIHTHSMYAQLATLLDPTEQSDVLRITHLEMLKGVGNHSYDSVLEVPIIDNRPTEDLLADQLDAAILKYPNCNAVLVRRHGIYAWGDSWEQAKAQCESFDYLFETAVKMKGMGLDSGVVPVSGTYRNEEDVKMTMEGGGGEEEKKDDGSNSPPAKRQKTEVGGGGSGVAPAFNASSATNNDADLECSRKTDIPIVPRDAKVLLLDIEGTTTSISFVKDVLFPYVKKNLTSYIDTMSDEEKTTTLAELRADVDALDANHVVKQMNLDDTIVDIVTALMDSDVKATGLKSLQGKMWKSGYASGELVGHIYSDFLPMLDWCKDNYVKVCIYSSGSIAAQKLLFKHTEKGDITEYFGGRHFDTTSGSKKESSSYQTIALALGVKPEEVIFVSDLEAEIYASRGAGMRAVVSVRPGNAPLSAETKGEFPIVRSLLQLCGNAN